MTAALSHVNDMFSGFEFWKLIYWGIGSVGLFGLIALLIWAPQVLGVVLRIGLRIVEDLLSTRVGVAVLTAVLVAITVDYMRHSMDDKAFAERTAAFEQQQKARDLQIAKNAKAEAQQQLDALNLQNADLDKKLKEFTDALPAPSATPPPSVASDDPFLVGAAACKLRVLAGTSRASDCGPPGRKGVPAARKRGARAPNQPAKRLPQAGAASPGAAPQGQ